ncbi:unnamed protein product, partial [marine sediment metagenome]
ISEELSNQTKSHIPMKVQMAIDSVPGASREDLQSATKILTSKRATNATDALKLAVSDRGGLVSEQPQKAPNSKARSIRASRHAKDSAPGKIDIPYTNNNDDIREIELAIAEEERKAQK